MSKPERTLLRSVLLFAIPFSAFAYYVDEQQLSKAEQPAQQFSWEVYYNRPYFYYHPFRPYYHRYYYR
ncbi:MAG: hypothetical protein JJU12_07270 [Chlamydiales bacterium]|nr:hypothetical protein [Chlamydiales bacterium]